MKNFLEKLSKNSDLALAMGLMGILAVMIVPMPRFCIDLLISTAIASSVVLLLTSVYATKALF
jgi:flagellar biosynthesis protein FlhA